MTPQQFRRLGSVLLYGMLWHLFLTPMVVLAADHTNLEENIPTQVEDAYPLPYLNREIQGFGRYEQDGEGRDMFRLEPRVEVGFARNWQARIGAPFLLGDADKSGSRDLIAEAMYNFNQESLLLPALALAGRIDVPSGVNSRGLDTHLRFLATKTIGGTSLLQRVHINATWVHNADPRIDERDNRYIAIVGYSARVARATVFVADYVREQQRRKGADSNIIELGIRQIINPLTVLSLGVGAGIAEESPTMRVTMGIQYSF